MSAHHRPEPAPVTPAPGAGRRFHHWLVLGVLLLNLLMVAIAATTLQASRQRALSQVRDDAANLAALLELGVGDSVRRIDLSLLGIVDMLEWLASEGQLSDARIEQVLQLHLGRHRAIDAFRLSDAEGYLRWGKGVDRQAPVSLTDRPFFAAHRAAPGAQLLVAEPVLGRVSKIPVAAFTRSWRRADGEFGGIVTAAVTLDHFTRQLAPLQLGAHGEAAIRYLDLNLLTAHPAAPAGVTPFLPQGLASRLDAGLTDGVLADTGNDGMERVYAFRRIPQTPFLLTVAMAPQDFLADWQQELQRTLVLLFAFFLATLCAAWLLRRSWRQLGDQAAFLHTLIENLPIPFFYKDRTGRYRGCNRAFEQLLGRRRDEIIGYSVFDMAPPEIAERYDEMDRRLFAVPGTQSYEWSVMGPEGRRQVIFHKATFADADGQIAGLLGGITDVSELKRVQEELQAHRDNLEALVVERTAELVRAKAEAESASRAKSAFLANMSHELRTPMNGIMGMIELVWRKTVDPRDRERLSKARQSSAHLLDLINGILDISKIEAERMTLEKRPFRLAEIVDNALGVTAHRAEEKGLQLRVEPLPLAARQALLGDPLRLSQVLINLLGNALKFTEAGTVGLRFDLLEESEAHLRLRCAVSDTGIGIAADALPRLFTPFEQADSSMTRRFGGTGLGLAISRRLVELMGGEIGVDSEPGRGSCFWFVVVLDKLPVSPGEAGACLVAESPELALRRDFLGARILLAEDDPINREVACDLLEDVGLVIDLADDGEAAVRMARENRYDLILMDMQMPKCNGVEAAAAIRAGSSNQQTPILAMTANAYEEDRRACLAAGMNDHLGKPVEPAVLFAALLHWLRRNGRSAE
ncbi:ATP-binding protein [Azonexus sp.]|uniref:hybrid sensor histidine kinase/response regulator n=1 Tax=Azonexus sp. TaxID=1872668 RepID=UPI0035ADEC1D